MPRHFANALSRVLTHIPTDGTGSDYSNEIEELEDVVRRIECSPQETLSSRQSQTESTLVQCVRDVIGRRTSLYKPKQAEGTRDVVTTSQPCDILDWILALNSIECVQSQASATRQSGVRQSSMTAEVDREKPLEQKSTALATDSEEAPGSDSDDDLEIDLARAACTTGTEAFEAKKWEEADSLLREATRMLQQLSATQRSFVDIFDLHYKLAICSFHILPVADAERALSSLLAVTPTSDKQRERTCDATHLLSQLCIRTGHLDRARAECEKALQSRRRLSGKRSDGALESLALLAHIQVLLNNRALAKSCLSMIPQDRREAVLSNVEKSLGDAVEHLDFASLLSPSSTTTSVDPVAAPPLQRMSGSTIGYNPGSPRAMTSSPASPGTTVWGSPRSQHTELAGAGECQNDTVQNLASVKEMEANIGENERVTNTVDVPTSETLGVKKKESQHHVEVVAAKMMYEPLPRREILQRMGCQPRDKIEEVVVAGDIASLTSLLQKKKGFWRSTIRKRGPAERVTALHFAALFGEINMARQLLSANFNINEIPFGYSTSLSPLHFAIGARQADMVKFLIANGARPSESDTWSSLAGQMLTRSWLAKTMSDAEKDSAPRSIVTILRYLVEQGWNVNGPVDFSGKTMLHQAVAFWTGEYSWDLNLRIVVASFLCENNADPYQPDKAGKTARDLAVASGHQELVGVLEKSYVGRHHGTDSPYLVELPAPVGKS